jgi:uncharacterized protein (DUF2237 family)
MNYNLTVKNKMLTLIFVSSLTFAQVNTEENCGNIKTKSKSNMTNPEQLNVLNTPLALASIDPMTGFYRNGYCQTSANDTGLHVVAALVTEAFLHYSLAKGNDLISAYPSSGFPGLKPGDTWCLCVLRWKEAFEAGVAPPVLLEATNIKALQYVTLEQLQSVK